MLVYAFSLWISEWFFQAFFCLGLQRCEGVQILLISKKLNAAKWTFLKFTYRSRLRYSCERTSKVLATNQALIPHGFWKHFENYFFKLERIWKAMVAFPQQNIITICLFQLFWKAPSKKNATELQEEDQLWPCCSTSRTKISNFDWNMYNVWTWNKYLSLSKKPNT